MSRRSQAHLLLRRCLCELWSPARVARPLRRRPLSPSVRTAWSSAVTADWIGRHDGRVIVLTRAGVGGAWLSLGDDGDLVGRLTRHDSVGTVRLSSPVPR
jgi:hypothetical protein